MLKKARLITNVMDRLTQAVVVGVWLLCKVVMSNHPINKGKIELNTRKNQTTHQNQSTTPESGEEDRCLGRKFKSGERISV